MATASAIVASALAASAGADQPAPNTSAASPPVSANNPKAAAEPAGASFQKPAWLTDLSLGVAESYDDNIYGVSGQGPMALQSSWVTTISPKLGLNLAPLLGDQNVLEVLSVGYAPEFAFYHDAWVESYNSHRVANIIKGKTDSFSFNLENAFTYVDGSPEGPIYSANDKYRSAFGTALPKDHRRQIQDRAKVLFQYDLGQFFVRPAASLLAFDMMTDLQSTAGYQNYPSRSDVNGGADAGYRVTEDVALTVGYRYGHQYQQRMSLAVDSTRLASDNDYQRALVGLEGKPWNGLTLSLQGGPDFRKYASTAAVSDRQPTTYYAEAAVAAEVTPKDSVAFKYKQWRWLSFCGRIPFFDGNYELSYHRKVTESLTLDLTGRISNWDFTCASDPIKLSNERNDYLYAFSPGLAYTFTPNLSVNLAYTLQLARNDLDNPPGGAKYRQFDRNLVSCGAMLKF
jgi:opacity protein-like surface antigen